MSEELNRNIKKAMEAKGLSLDATSLAAGLDRSYLSKLFRGAIGAPGSATLDKIAKALDVTAEQLKHGDQERNASRASDVRFAAGVVPPNPFDLPKDIPVLGTAAGSHARGAFQFSGDTIDYVRRPPALADVRDAYALYVEGTSMVPEFKPGDLVYVHPRRPARPGDPVVVQSAYVNDHDIEATIGIYVRTTERHLTIHKHNPDANVDLLRNAATKIHRVMTMNDLFSF